MHKKESSLIYALAFIALISIFAFIRCANTGGSGIGGFESGSVSGHIFLEGSVKPIYDVVVTCAGISDTTQKSGHYQIDNIPVGSQTIEASHPAYDEYNSTVIIRANETVTLDIFLRYDESKNKQTG